MHALPLPKSCSCLTSLFASELLAINSWHCSGDDTHGREDEWCDADRVVVTRRGSYELTIGGVANFVDPLVATFWNRGDYYRVRHPVSGTDECTIFRLSESASHELRAITRPTRTSPKTFSASASPIDGRTYLKHRVAHARARRSAANVNHTFDSLVESLAGGNAGDETLAIEETALEFLRAAVMQQTHQRSAPESRERNRIVSRTREILTAQFATPLSLAHIAGEVRCSPFHLSRIFRDATGVTLHRAVVQLRLREGLERLLDTPQPLSNVALDTGFASHSHFTDAFRAEYNCSPSVAKELLRGGAHFTGNRVRSR